MQTSRDATSAEGSLYELVARGAKDTFFNKDDKEAINPFDWRSDRQPATLPEIRYTNPLNEPQFGQRVEYEFDFAGDVLMEASLVIDLPSWLPPEMVGGNEKSLTGEVGSGDTQGQVNGVGYFLFEKIQLFQEKILLQEVSGDSLQVTQLQKGSWNQGFLTQKLAGVQALDVPPLTRLVSIQRNATPGRLEIRLPMIGCSWPGDRGLPICGLTDQRFRLRLTLRPLESLVECSNPAVTKPAPWNLTFQQVSAEGTITAKAIEREKMGRPRITLRTRQLQLLNEARQALIKEKIEIPQLRYQDNDFILSAAEQAPLAAGGTSAITRRVDAVQTVERIVTQFRNTQDTLRNRLWEFRNEAAVTGQWLTDLQLIIAGKNREGPWAPFLWQQMNTDATEERTSSRVLQEMNWSRGWRLDDVPSAVREPTGGINFTTADRPTFLVSLVDVATNPALGVKQVEMHSVCETWALYRIENGHGSLQYAN